MPGDWLTKYGQKRPDGYQCYACGVVEAARAFEVHLLDAHGWTEPPPEAPRAVDSTTPMTKEEALGAMAALIRDEGVPANQKGPVLSALARVAGWETAPEWDFEKERSRWMGAFEKMVAEDGRERERLEKVLARSGVLVEVGAMVERLQGVSVEETR